MIPQWYDPIFLFHAGGVLLLVSLYLWARRVQSGPRLSAAGGDAGFITPLLQAYEDPAATGLDDEERQIRGGRSWKFRQRRYVWLRQFLAWLLVVLLVIATVFSGRRHAGGIRDVLNQADVTLLLQAVYWLYVVLIEEVAIAADRPGFYTLFCVYVVGLIASFVRRPSEVLGDGGGVFSAGLVLTVLVFTSAVVATSLALIELLIWHQTRQGSEQPLSTFFGIYRWLHYPPTPEQKASLLSTCLFL
jgi:hypothetical protein